MGPTGESDMGRLMAEVCGPFTPSEFVFSWDAFPGNQAAITQMIGEAPPSNYAWPVPASASPGSRISGWRPMSNMIDRGEWKIIRSCTKLIRCIPTLVRDMRRAPEDALWSDGSAPKGSHAGAHA